MGALGSRTTLPFGVAVTCPGFRYHPVVIAHAAATLEAMYPNRFWLGLGAGEALNEHVVGGYWPEIGVRSSMMFEAIEIMDQLFGGKTVRHRGDHFTVERRRLWTLPDRSVPIYVATAGPINAKKAGRAADGMITRRGGRREDPHAVGPLRRGRHRARQGRPRDAQAAADPHLVGAHRAGGDRQRGQRVAQRRDALPQAGRRATPRTSPRWPRWSGRSIS